MIEISVRKKQFFLVLLAVTFLCSCQKSNTANPSSGLTVQGNVTLVVDVTHHYWGVPSIPVYIKFNTTQWLGKDSTKYDLMARADHEGSVVFNHLGPGDFEIYSAGYDSIWGGYVLGYNTWTITKADANNTVYANVVVSEKF